MTNEETVVVDPAGKETTDEKVELSKKDHQDMVEELANRTQDTTNLTAEIKKLRESKRLAEEEAERLKTEAKPAEVIPESGVLTAENVAILAQETVAKALQASDDATAQTNKAAALNEFKSLHKEFHEDNDAAGLKMSAFSTKLQRINMEGLKSKEDFLSAFKDAFALMPTDKKEVVDPQVTQPTPSEGGATIPEVELTNLSSQEDNLVRDSFDGDKERYLKIKVKRPDYVAELLRHAQY